MAEPITDNTNAYKKYIYRPPTPPNELIDPTVHVIDFTARKFFHVGLDHVDNFDVVIQIITPSRHVCISPSIMRRIFSLMGNILSFILDPPQNTSKTVFLETEFITLTSMVYRGENILVIESNTEEGCRVLLKRSDLINLQYMEWCIFETITRKTIIARPIVLEQLEDMVKYLEKEYSQNKPSNIEELANFVQNIREEDIVNNIPTNEVSYISQLKLYAYTEVAEHWMCKCIIGETQSIDEIKPYKPPTPQSPPTYSSEYPSTQQEGISIPKVYDHFDGTMFRSPPTYDRPISPSLSTSSGEFDTTISNMGWGKMPKQDTDTTYCDENDGPLRFNRISYENNLNNFFSSFK